MNVNPQDRSLLIKSKRDNPSELQRSTSNNFLISINENDFNDSQNRECSDSPSIDLHSISEDEVQGTPQRPRSKSTHKYSGRNNLQSASGNLHPIDVGEVDATLSGS